MQALTVDIEPARVTRVTFLDGVHELSYARVVEGWRDDASFRHLFSETLMAAPYSAFFWETRPVSSATLDDPYQCVLVDSPALAGVAAEPGAFERPLRDAGGSAGVAGFANIGGDAFLIAPRRIAAARHYAHLAAFVRGAPDDQRHEFWAAVGRAVAERVGPEPLWLSTSGLGVYWLHARLDSAPKYYTYAPYRRTERHDDD